MRYRLNQACSSLWLRLQLLMIGSDICPGWPGVGGLGRPPPKRLRRSPLTAHRSPLTAHRSPLTAHRSPLTAHCSSLRFHQYRPEAGRRGLVGLSSAPVGSTNCAAVRPGPDEDFAWLLLQRLYETTPTPRWPLALAESRPQYRAPCKPATKRRSFAMRWNRSSAAARPLLNIAANPSSRTSGSIRWVAQSATGGRAGPRALQADLAQMHFSRS